MRYQGGSWATEMNVNSLICQIAGAFALFAVGVGQPALAQSEPRDAPSQADAAPAVAADISIVTERGKTRFAITISKPVAAKAFVMDRPDRVIVDLPEVGFHLPQDAGRRAGGLIASYRYGLFAPGRSRMVIDLAQPALVSKIGIETGRADGTSVLVVELTKADRETFRKAAAANVRPVQDVDAPPITASADDKRPVIVVDPGHGGVDPGATASTGVFEKDIVFAFAQRLKSRLEAGGRYRVLMTRNDDVFVPLADRVRRARSANADLLISIHADSISAAPEVRGLTVYTGSERASDAESARLADRENRADAVAGLETSENPEEVADILQDLTLRETRAFSHRFAAKLVGELDPVMRLNKNPHRQAGFTVLRAPDVPSVLVELGYLSSRKDIELLVSDEWRNRTTDAMAVAIDRYFATKLANQGAAPVSP